MEDKLIDALDRYFQKDKKYIDTSRIPLICQDISQIHKDIKEIKDLMKDTYVTNDKFWPVRAIVYGGAGIILVGVFTALVMLVVP